MRLLKILALICALIGCRNGPCVAKPDDSVPAPFLDSDPNFKPMQYRDGQWMKRHKKIGPTATILSDNPRAYATFEIEGLNLVEDVDVEFFDGVSGRKLDDVRLTPALNGSIEHTIQLVASTVQANVAGSVSGPAEVRILRVLLPKPQEAVANELSPGLTPLWIYKGSPDNATQALAVAGESVALLQLSGIRRISGCTGFLVDPDVVATAAHCLADVNGISVDGIARSEPCKDVGILFNFLRSGSGGAPVKAIHCLSVTAFGQTQPSLVSVKTGTIAGISGFRADLQDVALMRIEKALIPREDGSMREPLKLATDGEGMLASLISYPQGGVERISRDCAFNDGISGVILHTCSTTPGSSGAPVLRWTSEGWRLIGLHVCCAGATPEDGSFEQLRKALSTWNLALPASTINVHLGRDQH